MQAIHPASQETPTHVSQHIADNHTPLTVEAQMERLNAYNDYWHEWAENRRANLPQTEKQARKEKFAGLTRRLIVMALFATFMAYAFNNIAEIAR